MRVLCYCTLLTGCVRTDLYPQLSNKINEGCNMTKIWRLCSADWGTPPAGRVSSSQEVNYKRRMGTPASLLVQKAAGSFN
jgi:hypothetical protein